MPTLRLGPIVRYADATRATVWVETDGACTVEIAGCSGRTFEVEGHHYAILTVDVGCGEPYEVRLDGDQVWPPPSFPYPPSRMGRASTSQQRVVFGSCRTILGEAADESVPDRVDALREYALRAAAQPAEELPDLLVLLGDQVYDRQGAPATRAFIRSRRSTTGEPGEVAVDFEEYTRLYWEAWSDPPVRWLLSTVPSIMIFDDHDVVDNWNTSEAWVEEMRQRPGWRERIANGLMAYWLYQHLGNHGPEELAGNPLLRELSRSAAGGPALRAFARSSDAGTYGTPGAQWSFTRDLGDVRIVMVDSRNGRCLANGEREMLDADEWAWLEEQARADVRHLLVATSVPFLLPPGLHAYEAWITALCAGAWGSRLVPWAERIRRGFQFTKWASFPRSFLRLGRLLREVATSESAPATVLVLSGDVHYSYIARVISEGAPIYQLVASPLCYDLERTIQGGFRAGISPLGARIGRGLARLARQSPKELEWNLTTGPWFRNLIATVEFVGEEATARLEQTEVGEPGQRLVVVAEQRLAPTPSAARELSA